MRYTDFVAGKKDMHSAEDLTHSWAELLLYRLAILKHLPDAFQLFSFAVSSSKAQKMHENRAQVYPTHPGRFYGELQALDEEG